MRCGVELQLCYTVTPILFTRLPPCRFRCGRGNYATGAQRLLGRMPAATLLTPSGTSWHNAMVRIWAPFAKYISNACTRRIAKHI